MVMRGMVTRRPGFTLIELLVVLSIVAMLLTLALPRYFSSVDKSKEPVLKENLNQMRDAISRYYGDKASRIWLRFSLSTDAISRYYGDKGKYPESLDALVAERYLRKVPLDPIAESTSTWQIVQPEDPQKGGVSDAKSGAPGKSLDGSEFSQW